MSIEVQELTKIYSQGNESGSPAVNKVSFLIKKGELVGLLGPNGAGKTTIIKCLSTLVSPTSGKISIDGYDTLSYPLKALERVASVLEGNRNIYWRLAVRQNLEFFAGLQGLSTRSVKKKIDHLLEIFQLKEKAHVAARMLSRGMQQKLAVACALIKGSEVLLLDEPTLGLDVQTSHELRELLKKLVHEEGKTILLSSHDMDVVEKVCERVLIINKGRLVTDEKTENLLKLFRSQAYRLEVKDHLQPEQAQKLCRRFPLFEFEKLNGSTVFHVDLMPETDLYEILDILKETGSRIESIQRVEPNLEEIFLRIVRR